MQRRHFLAATASVGAALGLPLSSAIAADAPARFTLLRAAGTQAGARFVPHQLADCADCAAPELQVVIGRLQPADGGAVLDRLALAAIFETSDGGRAPFHAWHHRHASHEARFTAPRGAMRSIEVEYAPFGAGVRQRETLALTSFAHPLLMPGDYVLAGPRRDGSAVDPATLRHTGEAASPLGTQRDFDYVTLRMALPA